VNTQSYRVQIKNNIFSIGRFAMVTPIRYSGLKPQIPIFVKRISQIIKKTTIKILAGKMNFHSLRNDFFW
jgi:hypothetical protein